MEQRGVERRNRAARFAEDAGPRSDEGHRPGRGRGHAGDVLLHSRRSLQDSWEFSRLNFYKIPRGNGVCMKGTKRGQ